MTPSSHLPLKCRNLSIKGSNFQWSHFLESFFYSHRGKKDKWRQQLSWVGIPVALSDTLKSLRKQYLLMTSCICLVLCDMEIMTYAETVPSWFLLKLKVIQLTWNRVQIKSGKSNSIFKVPPQTFCTILLSENKWKQYITGLVSFWTKQS